MSTAGVAVGAVVLAPALIIGGIVQSRNKDWVAREMVKRHTPMPADLAPAKQQTLVVFFPLAPSPTQIDLLYVNASGEHTLIINTQEILQGLHIDSTEQ